MPEASTLGIMAAIGAGLCVLGKCWREKTPVEQFHRRGRSLRDASEVSAILEERRRANDPGLALGQRRFPSVIGTRHFAFIGTTGSGKTLMQRLLMQSALSLIGNGHGQRAVVYDAKQDILGILAGMGVSVPILVLNPLDARAVAWDMAADIQSPASALQVAATLVPGGKSDANPFFTNAARQLVFGALLALIQIAPGRWTFRHLLLLLRDPVRLQALLARTESTQHLLQYFAHPGTAQNIFSTVLSHTTPFEIIAACWDRAG